MPNKVFMLFKLSVCAWICLNACMRDEKAALSLKAIDAAFQQSGDGPEGELQALHKALAAMVRLDPSVAEIELSLQALQAESKGDQAQALTLWTQALGLASGGKLGEKIFKAWLNSFVQSQPKPYELKGLTLAILQASDQGKLSAFMRAKKLNDPVKLEAYLFKHLSSKDLQPISSQAALALNAQLLLPPADGLPASDPLLQGAAKAYCSAAQVPQDAWVKWQQTLGPPVGQYWQALIAQCNAKPLEAISLFKAAAPLLAASKEQPLHALALASNQKLVKLLRGNDAREEAADYYKVLLACWQLPGISPAGLGLSQRDFTFNRINDILWAARYQALVGAYDLAKTYVKQAFAEISLAQNSLPKLTPVISKDLAAFQWEGYEILAFRIAYEQQEYAGAARFAQASLELPYLDKSWQERSRWDLGLYEFLDGKLEKAQRVWTELYALTKDEALQTKLLFWLARVYDLRGDKAKSQESLNTLAELFPLSYYNIVAPDLAQLPQGQPWKGLFSDPLNLEKKLQAANRYQTAALRHDETIAPLLSKLELLLIAGLRPWAMVSSQDLLATSLSRFKLKEEGESYLYLSRLFYAAENYPDSIRLTSDLSSQVPKFWQEHPEQVHIFFPRAFSAHFRAKSHGDGDTLALLYAIARQESLFQPSAFSPAAAVGLMQLLPATAKRLAKTAPLDWNSIAERLYEPEVNIELGSHYVNLLQLRYEGQLPAVIAAYNAGEYAVDIWQKRRKHPDPLVWLEAIPFGETRTYVQKVLRNLAVYSHLDASRHKVALHKKFYRPYQAKLQRSQQNAKH